MHGNLEKREANSTRLHLLFSALRFITSEAPNTSTQGGFKPQCSLQWNTINLDTKIYGHQDSFNSEKLYRPLSNEKLKPLVDDPEIVLDDSKFFLPILLAGPNDQLIGFIDSIFIAIWLNRTIVLPAFKMHF